MVKFRNAELVLPLEVDGTSQAGRIAIIVRDHDGRVKGLEIEDQKGAIIERRDRFHD